MIASHSFIENQKSKRQEILDNLNNGNFEKMNMFLNEQEQIFKGNKNDMSFITGGAGLVFLYLKAYDRNKDVSLLDNCKKILLENSTGFINSRTVGSNLYNGKAGLLFVLFILQCVVNDKDIEKLIKNISESILSDSLILDRQIVWYNPLELVSQPLCSFGYGAAGIVYVFNFINDFLDKNPLTYLIKNIDKYILNTLGEEIDSKCDFRKDIQSENDLKIHLQKFENEDFAFFKEGTTNYTIENGWLGIAFYLSIRGIIDSSVLDNLSVLNSENKKQLSWTRKAINSNQQIKNSLLGDCFLLPFFKLEKSDLKINFSDSNKIQTSVLEGSYDIFPNYLKVENTEVNIFGINIKNLQDHINTEDSKAEIEDIFAYETLFLKEMILYKQNPYENIKSFLKNKETMSLLNISDSLLLSKKLVFTREKEIKKSYKLDSENLLIEQYCLWQLNIEKGIEEYPFDLMSFIIFRFKKSKSIRQALFEMFLFCKFSKTKKIKPLIEYSNSKNKKDLLNRLPFLLVYQIRLLIKDQILEFDNYEDANSTKEKVIDRFLSKIGAYDSL